MKRTAKLTAEQIQKVNEIQEKSNTTRAVATKRVLAAEKKTKTPKVDPKPDGKQLAAHDVEPTAPKTEAPAAEPKAEKAPAVKLTPEQVSANRKEGARLFRLAGKPSRADFELLFGGRQGVVWTWEQRARHLGLSRAEDCAQRFQDLLAAKRGAAPAAAPAVETPAPVAESAEVLATATEETLDAPAAKKLSRKRTAIAR